MWQVKSGVRLEKLICYIDNRFKKWRYPLDLCDKRSGRSKNNVLYLAGLGDKPWCSLSGSKAVSHNALYFLCSDPSNFLSRILQGFSTRQGQGM